MLDENKKVELNEEQVEDVDGGLLAEAGLAAAMIFGQVAPATQQMEATPQVQVMNEQASTIELTKDNITLDNELTENGSLLTQKVKVVVDGVELEEGKDYTVKDNKAAYHGTYKLTVEGKDMYSGSVEVEYTIKEGDQKGFGSGVTAEGSVTGLGSGVTAEGSVTGLGSGVSANPENPAEQTPAQSQESTTQEKTSINNATIELETQLTYNGSPQSNKIKVTLGDLILEGGKDFYVENNVQTEVGTYTATVHGMGDFEGSINYEFTIAPSQEKTSINNASVTLENDLTYNGTTQSNKIKVTLGDQVLEGGKDFYVENNGALNAGTYTATVHGTGDYDGAVNYNYTIAQATLGDDNVQLSENLIYNKQEQTQKVTVTFNGTTLTEGTDYEVTNNKATDKGNYTLTVTGKGNFAGTVNKTFTIYSEKDAVKTGEQTNVALYAGVAGIAAAGLGAIAVLAKKRSKH